MTSLGMTSCPNQPCIFIGNPIPGQAPIYVGCYVDDFCYFSESDEVERWFETSLQSKLRVEFMGPVCWFLGAHFDWQHDVDGGLSVHLSQTGCIDTLVDRFGLTNANPVDTPYRSGLPIDRVPIDPIKPTPDFVKQYQSIVGGINWISCSTRPDGSVTTSLLAQFNQAPSSGHFDAAKCFVKYLKGTRDLGITFHQFD